MPNSVPPPTQAAPIQYRFRSGSTTSPWMSADQLKEAALRGELTRHSEVQSAGHAEWIPASNVRGLVFPAPLAPEPAPISADPAPIGSNGRHPRFATLRDLLAAYVNADVEVNIPDGGEFSPAHLCMVGTDHFELTLESNRSRIFVPYARIRSIWTIETSASATLTYRESHKLTIELESAKR